MENPIEASRQLNYCPSCGGDAFRQRGENSYQCEACGFILYLNAGSAIAAIIEYQDKILLIQRAHEPAKGEWDLPGGFADYHETAEEAVRREVREETGLMLNDFQYFCSHPNLITCHGFQYHILDLFYRAIADDNDLLKLQMGDEILNYSWVAIDKIDIENIAFESTRKALGQYRIFKHC